MTKLHSMLAAGVIAGCFGLSFVAGPVARADTPTTQKSEDKTPVNKMCAVETDQPIDPAVTSVYKGKTYAFCCKDCVKKFEKDPDKYAAAAK